MKRGCKIFLILLAVLILFTVFLLWTDPGREVLEIGLIPFSEECGSGSMQYLLLEEGQEVSNSSNFGDGFYLDTDLGINASLEFGEGKIKDCECDGLRLDKGKILEDGKTLVSEVYCFGTCGSCECFVFDSNKLDPISCEEIGL
jgi:hypothetical protein